MTKNEIVVGILAEYLPMAQKATLQEIGQELLDALAALPQHTPVTAYGRNPASSAGGNLRLADLTQ